MRKNLFNMVASNDHNDPSFLQSVAGMAFYAPLNDLGSGAVNTALARGSGSATFTRATTAYTTLSTGLLASVASGTARSNYSSAGEYLGYLAEQAATNLSLQSEDFSTTWTVSNAAIVTNQTAAPDGASTADKLNETAVTNTHFTRQTFTKAASAITYTASIYAKQAERSWIWVSVDDGTNGTAKWFNLGNGTADSGTTTFGTGFTSVTTAIYPAGNGFYRCCITFTTTTGTTLNTNWAISTGAGVQSYAGSANTGIYVWGGQLEQNGFVTSYIKTTTTSATRNADTLTYTTANINGTVGAAYAEVSSDITSQLRFVVSVVGGNNAPLRIESTNAVAINDGAQKANTSLTLTSSAKKIASSWGGSTSAVAASGVSATGTFDGNLDVAALAIGSTASPTFFMNGSIKNVRIWKSQLTPVQLVLLTK